MNELHLQLIAALNAAHDHMEMDPSGRGSGSRAMALVKRALEAADLAKARATDNDESNAWDDLGRTLADGV